jgi:hypothetical protein
MAVSFDPNKCIESVKLGQSLGHYFITSVAFGKGLCKSNLKTNSDIKKVIEKKKKSLMAASYLKLWLGGRPGGNINSLLVS